MAEIMPTSGNVAYRGYPDIDELYKRQLTETDPEKREEMPHKIQRTLHERTRFAPIWDYFWPSGIGPRVGFPVNSHQEVEPRRYDEPYAVPRSARSHPNRIISWVESLYFDSVVDDTSNDRQQWKHLQNSAVRKPFLAQPRGHRCSAIRWNAKRVYPFWRLADHFTGMRRNERRSDNLRH